MRHNKDAKRMKRDIKQQQDQEFLEHIKQLEHMEKEHYTNGREAL